MTAGLATHKIGIVFTAIFLGVTVHTAGYAQATHSVSIGGIGATPCAAWIKDRGDSADGSKQSAQQRIEWVSGFMSAINLFMTPGGNLHGGIDDREGMLSWIDAHCRANPNEPLFAATADFVLDLRNHPRTQTPQ